MAYVGVMSESEPPSNPPVGVQRAVDAEPAPLWIGKNRGPDNRVFGRLLRRYRTDQNMSAAEIADVAGVTASFVRSIERGDQAPSRATADKILAALGFDASEEPVLLTDPDTGARFHVREFTAAAKGDNSRWSLARLLEPGDAETFARFVSTYAHTPTYTEEQELEEQVEQQRALGRYGIAEGESSESIRVRAARRLMSASDEEVTLIHRFLDDMGVDDPADPIADYLARGYDSRDQYRQRGEPLPTWPSWNGSTA
jgi:transcriptional regulator with XRE-family HTH domain